MPIYKWMRKGARKNWRMLRKRCVFRKMYKKNIEDGMKRKISHDHVTWKWKKSKRNSLVLICLFPSVSSLGRPAKISYLPPHDDDHHRQQAPSSPSKKRSLYIYIFFFLLSRFLAFFSFVAKRERKSGNLRKFSDSESRKKEREWEIERKHSSPHFLLIWLPPEL